MTTLREVFFKLEEIFDDGMNCGEIDPDGILSLINDIGRGLDTPGNTSDGAAFNLWTFLAFVRKEAEKYPSQKDAAAAWGISPSYLSDILRARRKPGKTILSAFGLEQVEHYVPKAG